MRAAELIEEKRAGAKSLAAILADSHAARRCFVTQVRRFALGAGEDSECAAEALAPRHLAVAR